MDRHVPSPPTPFDSPGCDRPIRQILKIHFNSPDRVLRFTADQAFVGQGAASGAVRPAPAIRLYKRGDFPRSSAAVVNRQLHAAIIGITHPQQKKSQRFQIHGHKCGSQTVMRADTCMLPVSVLPVSVVQKQIMTGPITTTSQPTAYVLACAAVIITQSMNN